MGWNVTSLYVVRGRDQGIRFELGGDPVVSIGRDSSNDIQVHDTEISRRHARIVCKGNVFVWEDSKSSNGSFVNQKRVDRHELKTGDRIRLGRTWLLFMQTTEAQDGSSGPRVSIVDEASSAEASRILGTARPAIGPPELSASGDEGTVVRMQRNLQVMVRTSQEVSHTLDIEELCMNLLHRVVTSIDADRGCIMLVEDEGSDLQVKASLDRNDEGGGKPIHLSQTILDYVLQNEEGVLTTNAGEDERWETTPSIVQFGVREAICVPMTGRYSNVGILYVDTAISTKALLDGSGSRRFHQDHLELMLAIGHQAALAVENSTYYSALLQSERLAAVGHTVATLSHHIKNILQGMKGGGFLIEEGLKQGDTDAAIRGWKMVERNQQKISDLVLDMLTFSKARQPDLGWHDLDETVAEVIDLMKHRAGELAVDLAWSPSGQVSKVAFDAEGMQRAVLNLVTNAIDACAGIEGGRVEVSTAWDAAHQRVEVLVKDNGEGIPSARVATIFKPFESTKGNRGTGLGLPAARKIIREHGGDIVVESETGKGSFFRLTFPVQSPSSGPEDRDGGQTLVHDMT